MYCGNNKKHSFSFKDNSQKQFKKIGMVTSRDRTYSMTEFKILLTKLKVPPNQ